MNDILIEHAVEGCLKNISVRIPRNKLVVLTGVSGSGKSTLAVDVLFQECQRQYLEAMGMQGIRKPGVERIRNASPAILITQNEQNRNPRSTVGTKTDIYTDLRMVYEKLGVRTCPHCQEEISAADCREETEKIDGEFHVYMYCCKCGKRMEKLTRSHFSYNTKEGACPVCEGLGRILRVNRQQAVHEERSLEDGAVDFWEQKYGEYQISILKLAFRHFRLPEPKNSLPIREYTEAQRAILYEGADSKACRRIFPGIEPPKTASKGRFEGVLPMLWRKLSETGADSERWSRYFDYEVCPDCQGERLNRQSRSVSVNGTRLPELSACSLEELFKWVGELSDSLDGASKNMTLDYLTDLKTKLNRLIRVGLGYLTLDRQTMTLSGGELQRLKLAASLDSDLTGILYIMDEPTTGLHPRDTDGLLAILKRLRDMGNTVLVIEHDPDVMAQADHVIDLGPGAGRCGGEVIGTGTLEELRRQETSVTGAWLGKSHKYFTVPRKGDGGSIDVTDASKYNLKHIDVRFPTGCLTSVTGVSGSGKSTLVFEVLAKQKSGLDAFDQVVAIGQSSIPRMKRSNVATFTDAWTEIRKIFGGLPEAKERGFSAKHFSFNTPGGRCERCEGMGTVSTNMLFFQDTEVVCPVCGGKRFQEEVLSVLYKGCSICAVLKLSVEEARKLFEGHRKLVRILQLLMDVGLGYLELGQALTTLSGGEGQRLKLARELIQNPGGRNLYLMDEPTAGLHPIDVEHFLGLLERMTTAGSTVIVVEHNQQIIRASDWVIDLGPEGGDKGGELLYAGTPRGLVGCGRSLTAKYL